ncbi:MAG: DNA mismatch endonuclease Vsr [Deltaproteobacteria bacterium]|nr:DNA mismatch endonuclease Vsr [Deltaproteobacteria bacterium]
MAGIRQRGTLAELLVRAQVSRLRVRYTLKNRDLPGSPDLANRTHRWAIFVHGCYWHRHRSCPRTTTPTRNRSFWLAKFEKNQARDARVSRDLRKSGYRVLVVWECEASRRTFLQRKLDRFFA